MKSTADMRRFGIALYDRAHDDMTRTVKDLAMARSSPKSKQWQTEIAGKVRDSFARFHSDLVFTT